MKRKKVLTDIVIKKRSLFLSFLSSHRSIKRSFQTLWYRKTRPQLIIRNIRSKSEWIWIYCVFYDPKTHLIWTWSSHVDSEWRDVLQDMKLRVTEFKLKRPDLTVERSLVRNKFAFGLNAYHVIYRKSYVWMKETSIERVETLQKVNKLAINRKNDVVDTN